MVIPSFKFFYRRKKYLSVCERGWLKYEELLYYLLSILLF